MKKSHRIGWVIFGSIGVIGLGIGVGFLTTSCSSNNTSDLAFNNQINNQTQNQQTELINKLSVSLKQTSGDVISYATGFVFDENEPKNNPTHRNTPVDLLFTFYVMTNYHFYAELNPYLINTSHLSIGSADVNNPVVNNWYTLENINLNCAQTNPDGDVYVLHDPKLKTVYDIAVYKLEVNLADKQLPSAFSYFNAHKTELNYNTAVLTNKDKSNLITTAGYPYLDNKSKWNQYSSNQLMSNIIMDPLLSNYPTSEGYSFNNELVYAVNGMLVTQGASGSLVLNNSYNALAGIYFGFINDASDKKASYGMFIPFVAKDTYFHVTFKYNNQDCYFNIVNLNTNNQLRTQASPWINNKLYQANNYNNLINNQLFKNQLNANSNTQDVLNALTANDNLYLSLTINGSSKPQLIAKDISLKDLLAQATDLNVSLINNEQNIWTTWINNLNQAHSTSTYLTQLFQAK